MTAPARTAFRNLPIPQQAGILCNDIQFRTYIGALLTGRRLPMSATAATEYVREYCKIGSRRDLSGNRDAAARFAELHTEFDAWRGKIAPQI